MSSQNGTQTAQTSLPLSRFVIWLLGLPGTALKPVDRHLRTLAHFAGFFVLGGAAYVSARVTWPGRRRRVAWIIALCGAAAVLDEVKKIFITGRHLSWPEAGLNLLGLLCGVMLAYAAQKGAAGRKRHRGAKTGAQ
jgi:VanZ family protein